MNAQLINTLLPRKRGLRYAVLFVAILVFTSFGAAISSPVHAATPTIPAGCPGSTSAGPPAPGACDAQSTIDPAANPNAKCTKDNCDFIKKYINPFINLLSISFGLIAVISIIYGGIQYSASGGDPQKVTQAKQRIVKTIIAVLAYFFLYAFLQFIVPGGIFKS